MGEGSQSELVIGVSSQAIFDVAEEEAIFQSLGPEAFCEYQIAQEETIFAPGAGIDLVKMLLEPGQDKMEGQRVTVVLFSPNNADSSVRLFRSLESHGLAISKVALTSGDVLARYMSAFHIDLFLSTNADEVRDALHEGTAAAIINAGAGVPAVGNGQIRIAMESDAIVFSDESDRAYAEGGLESFIHYEQKNAESSHPQGPFAKLSQGLSTLPGSPGSPQEPVRISLITEQRGPESERVLQGFRAWNLRLAEAFFLDGTPRREVIEAFVPHIIFSSDLESWDASTDSEPILHMPSGLKTAADEKAA